MNIHTDRALVPAEKVVVRYCTVTIKAPKPDQSADRIGRRAHDASLVIRDSMGAMTTCLNDCAVERDVDGMHIELGDLHAGQEVTLVLATQIFPKSVDASTAILLRLSDRDRVLYGAPVEMSWTVVDAETDRTQPVNRAVIIAAANLLAERARAEAFELDRVGAADRAGRVLERAVGRIRALGANLRDVNVIANELEDRIYSAIC